MITVGLTGGIASGKTTATTYLANKGALIIDADLLAREVVAPGSEGLHQVREAFGEEVLLPDGSLDREKLGAIVFSEAAQRERLNQIIHPKVRELTAQLREQAAPDAIVIEAIPLLAETAQADRFDLVVSIEADPEKQVERLQTTRGMSADEACARLNAQASNDERRAIADLVLSNNGTAEEFASQLESLWQTLSQRVKA